MKTNDLKRSLWLAAILLTSLYAGAQTKAAPKTAYNSESNQLYFRMHDEGSHRISDIKTIYQDKVYQVKMLDEKITSLYVDGDKIPEADWTKYEAAIRHIRQEIKEQAKRDEEQAVRNQEQAKRNEEQAKRNAEQARRNEEQNVRNEDQAKRNAEQAHLNEDQAKRNAEQEVRNREQAKRNEEQVQLNKDQEKRNAEQAIRNQLQAKKNEEQAKANEQMIKDITQDMVNDKLIPDTESLKEFTFNADGMFVNGTKVPDAVFKKYKEKYNKYFNGNFRFSNDGIIQGN